MSLPHALCLSRVHPASCPTFKPHQINAVPRVPCPFTKTSPPQDGPQWVTRTVGAYIGKTGDNAGRGTEFRQHFELRLESRARLAPQPKTRLSLFERRPQCTNRIDRN